MTELREQATSRLRLLVGEDGMEKLENAAVFLCGTGGVGSYVAEALVRSGICDITVMDPDTVRPSNINRQLCALHSTLGRYKAEVIAERLRDIAPWAEISPLVKRLAPEDCASFLDSRRFTCVVDAIDERPAKIALITECAARGIPVVSSMGAANKLNPDEIRAADISQTYGCPLAKTVRKSLRKYGIEQGVRVVFSPELPVIDVSGLTPEAEGEKRPLGTISYMPGIFGLKCAAEALKIILR